MHALEQNEAIEKTHAANSSSMRTLKIPAKSTTAQCSSASYRDRKLHGHSWVHLLLVVGVGEGRLDLPVAWLEAVHEGGHGSHRHRVVLHRVPHVRGVQVLPLVGHNLGGLLTV